MGLHDHLPPAAIHMADAGFVTVAVSDFYGFLPHGAAILSVIWFAYQIYDMWDRRRARRKWNAKQRRRATDGHH